ncbi:MAG: hypothetical protein AAGG38_06195, partial [Planctomycetota bacterium]
RPGWAWAAAGGLVVAAGVVAGRAAWTDDLRGLLPAGSEGVVWQRRAVEEGGERGLSAVVVAEGMGEARAWTRRLRALPEVARVKGMGRLIPEDQDAKRARLDQTAARLRDAARAAAGSGAGGAVAASANGPSEDLVTRVVVTRAGLSLMEKTTADPTRQAAVAMGTAAERFLASVQALGAAERAARLEALAADYRACRRQAGALVLALIEDRPIGLHELGEAEAVFSAWVAPRDGGTEHDAEAEPWVMLRVFPTTREGGWPTYREMGRFLSAVGGVTPTVTGELERLYVRTRLLGSWAVGLAGLMLGVSGLTLVGWKGWKKGAGWGLAARLGGAWGACGLGIVAAAGVLGEGVTWAAVAGWPVAAVVVGGWVGVKGLTETGGDGAARLRSAGGDAFGLMLAAGFLAALGLSGADAAALTAAAVGACGGMALAGAWVLLVVRDGGETGEGHESGSDAGRD